jgi:hypothetical protein
MFIYSIFKNKTQKHIKYDDDDDDDDDDDEFKLWVS